MEQFIDKQSIVFSSPPSIVGYASVVGEKEGQGPLKDFFDEIEKDPEFGKNSWEEGESEMIKRACYKALEKSNLQRFDIRYIFGGDLLGQLIGTTFGIKEMEIPVFGLYGACSTCGEALSLAAMTCAGGYANNVLAVTSSHFGAAEKQFRFPLEYGSQRPLSATWTVTGSGAFVLSSHIKGSYPKITGITTGKIIDNGVTDSFNMGACMAPAAADVIYQNFKDLNVNIDYYDKIITGDLGKVGSEILIKLLNDNGYDIKDKHLDCGLLIFDCDKQDTHSGGSGCGGSGCGCAASTLAGYILKMLEANSWKRILFVPTGVLMSTVSYNEGETIPGIAHGVVIEFWEE